MNVIRSFTIQNLKVHKKWAIVTIIGIIISTAMLTAVSTFSASFLDLAKRQTIHSSGKWMVRFQNVPVSDASKLSDSSLCSSILIRKDLGYSALPDSKNIWRPYLHIQQFDPAAADHFFVSLTSGRLPQNDSELVISTEVADNAGVHYSLGDKITLDVCDRYSPDGEKMNADNYYQETYYEYDPVTGEKTELGREYLVPIFQRTYTVVGFFSTSLTQESWAAGYTCITSFAGEVASSSEKADLYIWSDEVTLQYYDQVRELGKSMGYSNDQIIFNRDLMHFYAGIDSFARQQSLFMMLGMIVLIIMTASVSLIYNAFSIAVSERTRQLGLLASAGATRKQKRYHVLFEGFLLALTGIPLGILFGILGIKLTFMAVSPLLVSAQMTGSITEMRTVVSVWTLAISVLLAAITVFISVLVPAFRASRITPIDAIRQSREIRLTQRSMRMLPFFRKIFGFEAELAMKNFRRNRRKYRATILSLVISLVLFLSVSAYVQFGILASRSTTQKFTYDIFLSFDEISQEMQTKVKAEISALPETEKIVRCDKHFMQLILDENDITEYTKSLGYPYDSISALVSAYDDEDFAEYAQSIGANPDDYMDSERPKVIVINSTSETDFDSGKKTMGEILNISKGDSLTAVFSEAAYDIDESETEFTDAFPSASFEIGAITEKLPIGCQELGFSAINAILPISTYMELIEKAGLSDSDMYSYPVMYIRSTDSRALELKIADIVKTFPSSQVFYYNTSSANESAENSLLLMGVFVYGFIILISLICVANIFNTITTNVHLRQKEFAMLRAVGMTPKSFRRMIRFESVFYGMKALLLGLPVSVGIAYILYRNSLDFFYYDFTLPWKSYLAAILLVFGIVFTTMQYAVSRVNKQNIIDSLKIDTM